MRSCVMQSKQHMCLFVRSSGEAYADDLRDLINILVSQTLYQLGSPVLHDMNGVDFQMSAEDLIDAGETRVCACPPPLERRVAVVVRSDDGVALADGIAHFRNRPDHKIMGFKAFNDAADWLLRPDLSAGFPPQIAGEMDQQLAQPGRLFLMKDSTFDITRHVSAGAWRLSSLTD